MSLLVHSAIAALNLAGLSTNGWCPESSNHASFFDGVVRKSGEPSDRGSRGRRRRGIRNAGTSLMRFRVETSAHMASRENPGLALGPAKRRRFSPMFHRPNSSERLNPEAYYGVVR
jgi:hypothetical protein